MNEEELFCKLFPEYVVNGKPLSLYFDLFESGYEQSEKRIAELEEENAEAKERIKTLEYRCENIKDTGTMELVALQRENAELKAEIENDRDLPAIAYMQGAEKQKRKDEEQLTKAKEILKAVVDFYPTTTATILCEAEQFLSEVEK